MRNILQGAARFFVLIRAATDIVNKVKELGIEDIKVLVDDGRSITEIYLTDCPPEKKAEKRQQASALFKMGITPEELWQEVIRRLPELEHILEGKDDYVKAEMGKIEAFLRGE